MWLPRRKDSETLSSFPPGDTHTFAGHQQGDTSVDSLAPQQITPLVRRLVEKIAGDVALVSSALLSAACTLF